MLSSLPPREREIVDILYERGASTVTEIGEALENFWTIDDPTLQHLTAVVCQVSAEIETERHQRRWAAGYTLKTDHNLLEELADLEIRPFELVVVNLYPFAATVASGASPDECVEQIDIGGPSMVRAAAKGMP